MILIKGILVGLIATIIFDIYQISLSFAYNINKSKWNLIGRYISGVKNKIFFIEDIENTEVFKNELVVGYFFHYTVGAIFGIIYSFCNFFILNNPSIFLAIFIGIITILGNWCILMPYAFNIGFFASKKDEQKQILVQNLLAHFIFGVGLFIGYVSIV